MSFKYRFILSFVTLEIFFILLIVFINFIAINNSSKDLTKQKIDSNISFLEEMIKIPISVYDLATLDNFTNKAVEINYINSIIILDNRNKIVSKKYRFEYLKIEELLKIQEDKEFIFENKNFEIKYKKLFEDNIYLGSMYIIFDNSLNTNFINETKRNNILLIFLEILVSTLLAYIIGLKLTNKLTNLSNIASKIGQNKEIEIPYLELNDEIGKLSKSLNQMQIDLINRNKNLKELNKTLIHQKHELIETQKYKDSFFANMSHELRTPLNSINILSSIMMKNKKGNFDINDVKNLEIINDCGKKLANLISDVLDISKIEAGQMSVEALAFDFDKSINQIVDMFLIQIQNKNLEFELKKQKQFNQIFNDEKLIGQILINLLSNAIKFTSKGKIEFIINDKNEYIEFIINDEGIGIPNDKLEQVFDRFKQVDGSIKRKFGGTGLGLAISKELVLMLDGEISVKSQLDKGSSFRVLIRKNLQKDNELKEEKILIPKRNKSNKKIIILNNEPLHYLDIVIELKRKYETVRQSSSLADLISKLNTENYDDVIVDLTNVKQDELIEVMKNKEFNLFVICDKDLKIEEYICENSKKIIEKPLNKEFFQDF